MLGWLGLDSNTTASTRTMRTSKIGQWAEARGAWVINVPRLSFQDIVDAQTLHAEEGFPHSHRRQGPWLCLEIPRLNKEHRDEQATKNLQDPRSLFIPTQTCFSLTNCARIVSNS